MRLTIGALTCLCLILSVSTAPAKEKKQEKQMDQQAMMELWKKMGMPGERAAQAVCVLGGQLEYHE